MVQLYITDPRALARPLRIDGVDHMLSDEARENAGHAGMAVEHRPGNEHVKGSLFSYFLHHVDHVRTGDDLVPGPERGLHGSTQRG